MLFDGYLMESAGRPFALSRGLPGPTFEIRDSLVVVRLPDAAVLRYGDAGWTFSGGGIASAQLGGRTVSLLVVPVDGTRFVLGDDDSIAVVSESPFGPSFRHHIGLLGCMWLQLPRGDG